MSHIIGHRGAKGLAPENTVIAVRKALEHHVDEIEIDLRLTKDGIIIVHHNATIRMPNGKHFAIAAHTYKELKRIKSDIATFDEVVREIDRAVPIYVEVKPKVAVEPIIQALRGFLRVGWKPTDFYLASFSQKSLTELHAAMPEIQKVIIESYRPLRAIRRAKQVDTTRIAMNQSFIWLGTVAVLARLGYQLYPYNLDNPKKFKRWEKHGLAGTITNVPNKYR